MPITELWAVIVEQELTGQTILAAMIDKHPIPLVCTEVANVNLLRNVALSSGDVTNARLVRFTASDEETL